MSPVRKYTFQVKAALTLPEQTIFERLNSPRKVQDYLDNFPINFEVSGGTYMSPRRVLREKMAHCFEAALFAAAASAYHGRKPLLMDLKTISGDPEGDHVVALFKEHGLWGAISKTNHAVLRYRDPVYRSVRELAMSYFHEYTTEQGRKSMRSFSEPFDLSTYPAEKWLTAGKELFWLVEALDSSRHFPAAPNLALRKLRKATEFERAVLGRTEWQSSKEPRRRFRKTP